MNRYIVQIHLLWALLLAGCAHFDRELPSDAYRPGEYTFVQTDGTRHSGSCRETDFPEALVTGKSGYLLAKFAGGEKWWDATYVNGKRHGICNSWNPRGEPMWTRHFRAGLLHGKFITWAPGGKKRREVDFVNGKKHGYAIEWDDSGNEISRVIFRDGTWIRETQNQAAGHVR
jgi:hypothetical protein